MPQIYLYREPVDFRKSFRGLAAIVEQELDHNPFTGALYALNNRQRNKTKGNRVSKADVTIGKIRKMYAIEDRIKCLSFAQER